MQWLGYPKGHPSEFTYSWALCFPFYASALPSFLRQGWPQWQKHKNWSACNFEGVCWACSLFLLPIARPQNCCSFLYTMWTGWKENYSPYPFHERRNWWNARLWLAQGVTQCLVSPMFSWICSWSPTWVLCTCNLLWKECLFLLLWKRKKEKCNSMLLLSQ